MDLSPYVSTFSTALTAAAQSASAEVQEAAQRLGQGMEPAVRLTLMEFASELAAEATSQLDGVVVDVRLRGGNPDLVVEQTMSEAISDPAPPAWQASPAPPGVEDEGGTARLSLRMPDGLKAQADAAAAAEGISTNNWLIRAVQAQLGGGFRPPTGRATRSGRTMTGWAR